MKLNLLMVSFAADAMRMLDGVKLSVSGWYSIKGVDWLSEVQINFSLTFALRLANLEGLPSNNSMGPVNARLLQDKRKNHGEQRRHVRPEGFLKKRPPTGQHKKKYSNKHEQLQHT